MSLKKQCGPKEGAPEHDPMSTDESYTAAFQKLTLSYPGVLEPVIQFMAGRSMAEKDSEIERLRQEVKYRNRQITTMISSYLPWGGDYPLMMFRDEQDPLSYDGVMDKKQVDLAREWLKDNRQIYHVHMTADGSEITNYKIDIMVSTNVPNSNVLFEVKKFTFVFSIVRGEDEGLDEAKLQLTTVTTDVQLDAGKTIIFGKHCMKTGVNRILQGYNMAISVNNTLSDGELIFDFDRSDNDTLFCPGDEFCFHERTDHSPLLPYYAVVENEEGHCERTQYKASPMTIFMLGKEQPGMPSDRKQ